MDKHWTVKRSQLERRQRLYCKTRVRRGPRVTTTWTRERCVHTSFPFGFLLTRLKVAVTDFGQTNFGLPHLTATGQTILSDFGQPERIDFGHIFWWPALAIPTLANFLGGGERRLKQNFGKGGSRERRRKGERQTRKKESGTINVVHVLCEGVAGRRRRLHTKHCLCPPLGFQWTFMLSIAGGLRVSGFRFLGLRFSGFRFQGLGRQGETKN